MNAPADQVTPSLLREWPLPEPGGSKHSRGHVLVIGGARSTPGAVLLAGIASLRVGAGVLAMAVPEDVAVSLAVAVPEAAVTGWPQLTGSELSSVDRHGFTELLRQASAVLLGPGLDNPDVATLLLELVTEELAPRVPVVLDAFALGVLPENAETVSTLAGRVVLTPNPDEAARLLGNDTDIDSDIDDADTAHVATSIAEKWQAVVSYQGAVAEPSNRVRVVPTGHSGLGTSGSGDVLAGAIVGLLARGADPVRAACWGTYVHAAAGDRLAARVGRLGFLARELLDEVPLVLTELQA
jgi:ADP-dependent NAD(P)H-hydrate dehydratase